MSRLTVSKALREVWAWKDACYRDVARLPTQEALTTLLENADRVTRALNLNLQPMPSSRRSIVAEEGTEYVTGRRIPRRQKKGTTTE